MSSVLKIPFTFADTKTRTITLQDPKSGITQTEVKTFGNYAINNDLLRYNGVAAVSVEDAYIYNTNEIPIV